MRKAFICLLALALILTCPVPVSAVETVESSVPVVLTVVNTATPISVTVPAALPVSVVDGVTLTATNARIANTGKRPIQVVGIQVLPGTFSVGNFQSFIPDENVIALALNGCGTTGAGPLALSKDAFPVIGAQDYLPLRYQAKVSATKAVTNQNAATVVFTIGAADV